MVNFLSVKRNEDVISLYCQTHTSKELREKSKLPQSYLRLLGVFFRPDYEWGSVEKLRFYRLILREKVLTYPRPSV